MQYANDRFGSESTLPARFEPNCDKKEKRENINRRAKWGGGEGELTSVVLMGSLGRLGPRPVRVHLNDSLF